MSKQKENKSNPLISVLVPIYNVEKYLKQCLNSIVNQTFKDIEIICLNDGSTDNSLQIIKDFQERDSRIVIVDKPNSGYGDSMNLGLEKAKGEYIGIVESDDYIDLDAFEKLYHLAKINDAEVVRANYYTNKNHTDKKLYYINPVDAGKVVDPARHTWIFLQAPAIWSAIYKRDFLNKNHIRFLPTPGASYQDTGFNFKVWAAAKRAYFTTEAFLHYRIDNESSSVNNPGKVMNVCYEYESIEEYLRKYHYFEELGPIMETAKFGAYYWNLLRLKPKLLRDFIKRTKEEFQKADDEHILFENYFDAPKWEMLQYILNHHNINSIKLYIKRQKLKLLVRGKLKDIYLTIFPTYRKQALISELITELYSESDLVETRLKLLEDQRKKHQEANHENTKN